MRIPRLRQRGEMAEMDKLFAWLVERIDEDAAAAREQPDPARAIAAVAAKRRSLYHAKVAIDEYVERAKGPAHPDLYHLQAVWRFATHTMRCMAIEYANNPGYTTKWRP